MAITADTLAARYQPSCCALPFYPFAVVFSQRTAIKRSKSSLLLGQATQECTAIVSGKLQYSQTFSPLSLCVYVFHRKIVALIVSLSVCVSLWGAEMDKIHANAIIYK